MKSARQIRDRIPGASPSSCSSTKCPVGAFSNVSYRQLGKDDKVVNEEPLLMDLGARIRDVQVFPDGAVYVLTEGGNGKLLKVTPNAATSTR